MKLFSNEKAALSLSGWAASQLALALFAPPPRLPVLLTRAQIVGSRNRGQHVTAARHEPRGFGVGVLQHGELLGWSGRPCSFKVSVVPIGWQWIFRRTGFEAWRAQTIPASMLPCRSGRHAGDRPHLKVRFCRGDGELRCRAAHPGPIGRRSSRRWSEWATAATPGPAWRPASSVRRRLC